MIFLLKLPVRSGQMIFLQMRRNEMAEGYPDGITIDRMYEAFLIFYLNEESEVLFLCLLLIRKKMYLIFSGMKEEAFCTLKLNKNNNGGYL